MSDSWLTAVCFGGGHSQCEAKGDCKCSCHDEPGVSQLVGYVRELEERVRIAEAALREPSPNDRSAE